MRVKTTGEGSGLCGDHSIPQVQHNFRRYRYLYDHLVIQIESYFCPMMIIQDAIHGLVIEEVAICWLMIQDEICWPIIEEAICWSMIKGHLLTIDPICWLLIQEEITWLVLLQRNTFVIFEIDSPTFCLYWTKKRNIPFLKAWSCEKCWYVVLLLVFSDME